jgi:hypothetical protein
MSDINRFGLGTELIDPVPNFAGRMQERRLLVMSH